MISAQASPPKSGTAFAPSPEQERVIAHRGGHLQVVACAGAGKTEAISRRVAALIEGGVEPSQIVAFTFTERAAEGLKARISRRVAQAKGQAFLDRIGPMFVGTIHVMIYCSQDTLEVGPALQKNVSSVLFGCEGLF
jgi:DNA helicase-2/ATP-dependent DNA helicase PcrA